MASRRFRDLERETKRLRKELLPDPFDPLGVYPPRVQNRTRAFLLLAHAAVEGYLEAEAKRIARKAEDAWKAKRHITRPLAFLLGGSMAPFGTPDSSGKRSPENLIADGAEKAFQGYYKAIKENHGLKEKNMMSLFGLIGVESSMFGTMLLPSLDSFGRARGDHAHHGAAVVAQLDPQTEYDRVNQVLKELETFDGELRKYQKASR